MGRSSGGARTESRTERRADRQTDRRPRTRRRTELGAVSFTHTRRHSPGHADTRTLARTASLPGCPPARRRLEPALAGKCGISVGAFVWGAGRRRAQGPSPGRHATETSSSPQGSEASARPRHAPVGLTAPPDLGGRVPTLGRKPGAGEPGRSSNHSPRSSDAVPGRGQDSGPGSEPRRPRLVRGSWLHRLSRSAAPEGDWKSPLACWLVNCGSLASPPPDRVA